MFELVNRWDILMKTTACGGQIWERSETLIQTQEDIADEHNQPCMLGQQHLKLFLSSACTGQV